MAIPTSIVAIAGGQIRHVELIPMAMMGAMSVVGFWLAVSIIFGRIYCSTFCPVGTLQDISAWLPMLAGRKKMKYTYKQGQPWYVRVSLIAILIMAVFFTSLAVSWSLLPFLQLSPYDSYVDIVSVADSFIAKITGNSENVPISARIVISAFINIIFIVSMGMLRGRDLCNVLCPVGSALGAINQLALFHFDIDTDRCIHCKKCDEACKASCVNSDMGTVDASRCVACFDCVSVCPDGAMQYTTRRHKLSIPMMMKIKGPAPSMSASKQ